MSSEIVDKNEKKSTGNTSVSIPSRLIGELAKLKAQQEGITLEKFISAALREFEDPKLMKVMNDESLSIGISKELNQRLGEAAERGYMKKGDYTLMIIRARILYKLKAKTLRKSQALKENRTER